MEDVALSQRAEARRAAPLCLRAARRSPPGRRWEKRGVLRTIVLMWRLRLPTSSARAPSALAQIYQR